MLKNPLNLNDVHDRLMEVSPRTRQRLIEAIRRADWDKWNKWLDQKVVRPQYQEHAISRRTALRKSKDIRAGREPADRPAFVAWDGEGWEVEDDHKYTLLANSNHESIADLNGLDTETCLQFMVEHGAGRQINIFYSFGYDIQQIIKDLPDDSLDNLMHGSKVRYRGFSLEYFAGKIFVINNHVRFYDIFPFFHSSFVVAIHQAFGRERVSDSLLEGKRARGNFETWDFQKIKDYNDEELVLLKDLGEWLRSIFEEAGIYLGRSYYGPGAIAKYWFKKYRVAPIKISDSVLSDIFERAYFGGRFETVAMGRQSPVFEYDLHSAYPSAIRELRYIDDWVQIKPLDFRSSSQFSVWHVEWHLPSTTRIGPFPSRDKNGLISYPANGRGWYYKPEIIAARSLYGPQKIKLLEGYNPQYISEEKPFWWVEEMYNRRAQLKAEGNPAQMALKLGLNSLYGKTAQRVGKQQFFCLPWAGWITSHSRAKLLSACVGNTSSVIAFATDAVYTTGSLSLDTSGNLGSWESKEWREGYFIQSGLYRLVGESTKDASRSYSQKNVQKIFDQLNDPYWSSDFITLYEERFVTHNLAIKFPKAFGPYRMRFITIKKKVAPFKPTKRALADPIKYHHLSTMYDDINEDIYPPPKIQVYIPPGHTGNVYSRLGALGVAWPMHHLLLTESIETRILENHNDHADPFYGKNKAGDFEESYPFRKLVPSLETDSNVEASIIANERLGGPIGLVKIPDDAPIIELPSF